MSAGANAFTPARFPLLSRELVQVREHDSVALAGNGLVHDLRVHENRVFALELFGTLTLLDTVWTLGCRHAALVPVATFREQAWVQAAVPLGRCAAVAALHAHTLAVLHFDEYLNRCAPAAHPEGAGLREAHACMQEGRRRCLLPWHALCVVQSHTGHHGGMQRTVATGGVCKFS